MTKHRILVTTSPSEYLTKYLSLPFWVQGSTDFGNVSFVVPGIHPYFYIGTDALNHTEQYTEAAGEQANERARAVGVQGSLPLPAKCCS